MPVFVNGRETRTSPAPESVTDLQCTRIIKTRHMSTRTLCTST